MADLDLTEFDAIPWTEADEGRPDVQLSAVPHALSERGKFVLAHNPSLRGVWDETANHFPSDSERAYSIAWHAGRCGLSKEDAAYLLHEFYARPGKKKLHVTKLVKTLRAWQKGREEAEREEIGAPRETAGQAEPPTPAKENGAAPTTRHTAGGAEPFEVLAAAEFLQASFHGATRLVPSIGLTESGVGLLSGPGGAGKSVLSLNLALAWTGVPLPIGEAIPPARTLRVMVFQAEDAPGIVQERLRKILGSTPVPCGLFLFTRMEPMRFSGAKGRPNERGLDRLQATLRAHAPIDVAIFDPLVYLHEAEENSSSEMARWLVPLRDACRATGTAPFIIHHAGWAPDGEDARGRGSTAIRAWSDLELALRGQAKSHRTIHRLNLVKTNFASRWKRPLTLELNEETLRFQVVDETGTLCPPEDLVAWLREEHGGVWTDKRGNLYEAIVKQFGCERRTAQESVKRAKALGFLVDHGQRKPLEVVANSSESPQ